MSTLPAGSMLTISTTVCGPVASLVVDTLTYAPTFEPLDRKEFDNTKQATARTSCGATRLTGENLFKKPFQVVSDCSDLTAVPLWPNDDTTFDNVKRKFKIKEYSVIGAISADADVEELYALASNHQDQLAKFQRYLARVAEDPPYTALIALQSETFDYLTTTGVTISGSAMSTSEDNVLITRMSADNALVIALNSSGSSYEYYKTYKFTFQTRQLVALDYIA